MYVCVCAVVILNAEKSLFYGLSISDQQIVFLVQCVHVYGQPSFTSKMCLQMVKVLVNVNILSFVNTFYV